MRNPQRLRATHTHIKVELDVAAAAAANTLCQAQQNIYLVFFPHTRAQHCELFFEEEERKEDRAQTLSMCNMYAQTEN